MRVYNEWLQQLSAAVTFGCSNSVQTLLHFCSISLMSYGFILDFSTSRLSRVVHSISGVLSIVKRIFVIISSSSLIRRLRSILHRRSHRLVHIGIIIWSLFLLVNHRLR